MIKEDKKFYKELKKVQLAHKPEKWEARQRYNWKKEWGPFIKYDADWDGSYLLELIVYKLEKMYLGLDIYSDEVREDLNKKLKILKETIDLGKKVLSYDYEADYHAWGFKHCAHIIYIYKKTTNQSDDKINASAIKAKPIHKIVRWQKEDLDDKDPSDRLKDYLGTKAVVEWAKENGYNPEDLTTAYGGEWDDKANYKIWKQKVKAAAKAEQKDIDDFFKLIARNYRGWWW